MKVYKDIKKDFYKGHISPLLILEARILGKWVVTLGEGDSFTRFVGWCEVWFHLFRKHQRCKNSTYIATLGQIQIWIWTWLRNGLKKQLIRVSKFLWASLNEFAV